MDVKKQRLTLEQIHCLRPDLTTYDEWFRKTQNIHLTDNTMLLLVVNEYLNFGNVFDVLRHKKWTKMN